MIILPLLSPLLSLSPFSLPSSLSPPSLSPPPLSLSLPLLSLPLLSSLRWLLINSTDPGNMLKWFSDELLDSENKGQKVHVIGHIPPGANDCLGPWSSVYVQLSER